MTILGSISRRQHRRRPQKVEHKQRPPSKKRSVPTAELVECTCPDPCQRDHETD